MPQYILLCIRFRIKVNRFYIMKNYIISDLKDYLRKLKDAKKNIKNEEKDIMDGI